MLITTIQTDILPNTSHSRGRTRRKSRRKFSTSTTGWLPRDKMLVNNNMDSFSLICTFYSSPLHLSCNLLRPLGYVGNHWPWSLSPWMHPPKYPHGISHDWWRISHGGRSNQSSWSHPFENNSSTCIDGSGDFISLLLFLLPPLQLAFVWHLVMAVATPTKMLEMPLWE